MTNTMLALFNLGGMEIVLILALVLILFGAKKLPDLAKGLGQGIKEFKKATREVTDEVQRSVDDNHYSQPTYKQVEQQPAQAQPVAENTEAGAKKA